MASLRKPNACRTLAASSQPLGRCIRPWPTAWLGASRTVASANASGESLAVTRNVGRTMVPSSRLTSGGGRGNSATTAGPLAEDLLRRLRRSLPAASPRTRRPDPCERPRSLLLMFSSSSPVSAGALTSPDIPTDRRRRSLRRLTTRSAATSRRQFRRDARYGFAPRARRIVLRRRARPTSARTARAAFLPGPPVTPPPGCAPAPHM